MWLEIQREAGRVSYDTEVYHPLKYMKFKSSASLSTSVYEFKNEGWYLVTADASLKNLKCSLFGLASPGQMVEVLWSQQERFACYTLSVLRVSVLPSFWAVLSMEPGVDWQSVSALIHVISVLKLRLNLFKEKSMKSTVTLQVMMKPKPTQCILDK